MVLAIAVICLGGLGAYGFITNLSKMSNIIGNSTGNIIHLFFFPSVRMAGGIILFPADFGTVRGKSCEIMERK